MLKQFRKHTKIIVWVIVVSFVIWGGYSATTLKKEGRYAGEVFGKPVTFQEFNRFYNATQLFMPSNEQTNLENPEVLRTFTWQNIIYAREAQKLGIKVTDAEVQREIANILSQQGIVNPTKDQYRVWLTRTLRLTPREFEEGLREFIRIQKLMRSKFIDTPESAQEIAAEGATENAEVSEEDKKQKQEAFIQWTNKLNQRADLQDYLALPPAPEEVIGDVMDPENDGVDEVVEREEE